MWKEEKRICGRTADKAVHNTEDTGNTEDVRSKDVAGK